MLNIFKAQHGMNIVGQGGKIILFTLPSLIAAILVNTYLPQIAALPRSISFIKPVGYILLIPGLILWGAAVIQLERAFPKVSWLPLAHMALSAIPSTPARLFSSFPASRCWR
jgi:hypothetical protein